MAGTSPRRSVRARTTQPPHSGSHHSSASSNSSGRADRTTAISTKVESPRKPSLSDSLSSEPPDDAGAPSAEDASQTRRRKRGQVDDFDKTSHESIQQTIAVEEGAEDDEAVRCICGFDDYPGPPQISDEDKKHIKDSSELEILTSTDFTEDLAGFFLQCDTCKVWQHGGCVGIKNEDMSPDEYFCEQCRKDLHKILFAVNGQKYSHYLPLYQSYSRSTSRAASFSKDGTRSPRGSKSGRPSSSLQSGKRRSTMNSRDAAYDEEEQLRRAIEASKGAGSAESTDGGTRRGKRGRSDSEEKQEPSKRQRTLSDSPSPSREPLRFNSNNDSDDALNARNGGPKKIRGAAARNHREKEQREEKERIRQEAANKRKGRAERRRVDGELIPEQGHEHPLIASFQDSDPSDDIPAAHSGEKTVVPQSLDPPPSSQPDTPPTIIPPAPAAKKGGRPPHGRKGKVGKNQYTRDKDPVDTDDQSPHRSLSRDVARNDDSGHTSSHRAGHTEGKPSKSKNSTGAKVTMLDMKRKVAGMLEYISRTQLEMASESGATSINGDSTEKLMRGIAGTLMPILQATNGTPKDGEGLDKASEKDFKKLTLLEMMDVLTGELVKWQKQFEQNALP